MRKKKRDIREFSNVMTKINKDEIAMVIDKMSIDGVVAQYLSDGPDEYITDTINVLQYIYNSTDLQPPITDDSYDRLYALYIETNPDIVGASASSDKNIKNHRYPDLRGTLDKVHYFKSSDKRDKKDSRRSVEEWTSRIEKACVDANHTMNESDYDLFIYPKWDGISCIDECDSDHVLEIALTRGDVKNNEAVDISKFLTGMRFDDLTMFQNKEIGVKTEIVMSNRDFEKVKKEYDFSSPRSVISSIFNSDDMKPHLLKYITVIPLRVQDFESKDVEVVTFLDKVDIGSLKNLDELEKKSLSMYNEVSKEFPIDGVVFHLCNKKLHGIMGRKDNINKFEIAFKFPAESKITKLKDVLFSIGKLGGITPVALFEPVVIKGNSIENASLGSIDRFNTLNLAIGDDVEIEYEIIPYLKPHKYNGGDIIKVPTKCSMCNSTLVKTPLLSCVNPECPAVKAGRILNYINKMSISFLSIGILAKLVDNNIVDSILDLYTLESHRDAITSIDGLGDKTLNKIIKSINSKTDIYMYELLGSIGIDSMGRRTFKKICDAYKINSLSDIYPNLTDKNVLLNVPGIQTISADKISKGLLDNEELITKLVKYMNIKSYTKTDEDVKPSVYFTNVRDNELQDILISKGMIIAEDFNKKVELLIIPDDDTKVSKKVDKALKWGIGILKLSDAKKLFTIE